MVTVGHVRTRTHHHGTSTAVRQGRSTAAKGGTTSDCLWQGRACTGEGRCFELSLFTTICAGGDHWLLALSAPSREPPAWSPLWTSKHPLPFHKRRGLLCTGMRACGITGNRRLHWGSDGEFHVGTHARRMYNQLAYVWVPRVQGGNEIAPMGAWHIRRPAAAWCLHHPELRMSHHAQLAVPHWGKCTGAWALFFWQGACLLGGGEGGFG